MADRFPNRVLVGVSLLWLVTACTSDTQAESDPERPTIRIVSLSPHLTEIAFAAGAGEFLVGVVEYSDFPDDARNIPRIGDAFQLDYERLAELRPDLILAWDTGNPVAMIQQVKRLGYRVEVITTTVPSDVETALLQIGRLAGTEATATAAADRFRHAVDAITAEYSDSRAVTVFYQIAVRPLYTIGGNHYISRLIELCGGRNIFSSLASPAAAVGFESVIDRDPEVILAGDDIPDDPFAKWKKWPQMRAVESQNLYKVRANLISRATPRSVEGARDICTALNEARAKK